ncbi:hypothetical protein FEK35_25115 [Nocardia cyriacigeorgica]|uniref:Uncharacterized protein n=1 Tax=Nocardia cyriacigeorgica TaxID=135487 RepID=A0A5R8P7B6_9NOCA|nr:hypothetical protein [Nocardia cyriacigeorgica]TLF98861.1 hypothetical protein FEK35_25115 [Nocardia cyriacigeorgica]
MDSWHVMSSVVSVLVGCAIAVVIIGCLWPGDAPQRVPSARRTPPHRNRRPRHGSGVLVPLETGYPASWTAWTCDLPRAPLTLADAHQAMRHHREHDCARKRAAFATLIAAGRMTPDSSRRYRWAEPW